MGAAPTPASGGGIFSKSSARMPAIDRLLGTEGYFSCVETEENVVLRLVPMPATMVTMTIEIPTAIRAYSIAVAAVSLFRKARNFSIIP